MEILKISYRTYRWATTNPPINESNELLLEKNENGITLTEISQYNADTQKKHYTVSKEQYGEIISLFSALDIYSEFSAENPNGAIPPMMGGGSGASLLVETDCDSLNTAFFTEKISSFINRFTQLKTQCGEPFKCEGEIPRNIYGASAPVPAEVAEKADNEPTLEGEWRCAMCGYAHNTGAFCIECGQPEQTNN